MRAFTFSFFLAVALPFSAVFAQTAPSGAGIRDNALYVEGGGNMGDFSANYERLVGSATVVRLAFGQALDSYGDCFGIGFVSACEGEVDVTLGGLMVSRLVGRRHMAELGLGAAYGFLTDKSQPIFGEATRDEDVVTTLTATLGYRFQTGGRWLARAGYTPSYGMSGETANYSKRGFSSAVGASLGIAF